MGGSVSLVNGHIDDDVQEMTLQEAIRRIKNHNEIHSKNEHFAIYITEALNMAVDALEKQIPKKPDYEADGYDENGILIYDRAICPNCENDDFEYDINNWGCKFCPDCGQALDWSDTE